MSRYLLSRLKPPVSYHPAARSAFKIRMFNRVAPAPSYFPSSLLPFLCGALIIFVLSVRDNRAVSQLNTVLLDITMPLVEAISRPFTVLDSWRNKMSTYQNLQAEIAVLREKNERYLLLVQSLKQKVVDYYDLEQLAKALPDAKIERISARVTGRISDGANAMLTIRATAKERLVKNQPVITAEGVIGRISEVGGLAPDRARVLPLTDMSSRIPVEVESTHEHGIIAGQNQSELRLIHLKECVKVKVGDRLITSGYGGIFPRGIPVAVVTHVEGEVIKARPFVKETPAYVTILLSL